MAGNFGGHQGTPPQYLSRKNLDMPRSFFRASVFERPRSNVVAEESNEERIRWVTHVTDRIDQDGCRCTARFCNIPENTCLGGKQIP